MMNTKGSLFPEEEPKKKLSLKETLDALAQDLHAKQSSDDQWTMFIGDASEEDLKKEEIQSYKDLWSAACEISSNRLKAIQAVIEGGFTEGDRNKKLSLLRKFFKEIADFNANPFEVIGEDGDSIPAWSEFGTIIDSFKNVLTRLEIWEGQQRVSDAITELENPLGTLSEDPLPEPGLTDEAPATLAIINDPTADSAVNVASALWASQEPDNFPDDNPWLPENSPLPEPSPPSPSAPSPSSHMLGQEPEATVSDGMELDNEPSLPEPTPDETTQALTMVNDPATDPGVDTAKEAFESARLKVARIEGDLEALGRTWPFTAARARKTQLTADLVSAKLEKTVASVALRTANEARKARAKAPEPAPSQSSPVATEQVVLEVRTHPEKPEPASESATIRPEILQRIKEGEALWKAQAAKAAQAERDRKALEAARIQKAADLEKAKADLAKMSGVGGFFRSMFNWGEKERLQAEVARLTTELGAAEKAVAQAPAQPEHTPGILDWLRTSTAAKVATVAVAGVLALGAGSFLKKSGASDQSPDTTTAAAKVDTPTPSEAALPAPAPTPSEATLPAPATSVTASTASMQNFTPSNTLWKHFEGQGLKGKALVEATNDAVIAANIRLNDSQLHDSKAFKSVTKEMAKWGGYDVILKGAKGAENLQSFLDTVPANQKPLVEGMAASVLGPISVDPMDAPLPGMASQAASPATPAAIPAATQRTYQHSVDPTDAP